MMKVLLIVPAYNEEQNIERVVEQILSYRKTCPYFLDYIVINDGSTDQTELICRQNGIHHIALLQNLGIGGAVQTGYMYAVMNGYDVAVQFDGDGQHDIRCLMDLVQPIINDQCDFCIGSRFVNNTSSFRSTKLRRIGIKMCIRDRCDNRRCKQLYQHYHKRHGTENRKCHAFRGRNPHRGYW